MYPLLDAVKSAIPLLTTQSLFELLLINKSLKQKAPGTDNSLMHPTLEISLEHSSEILLNESCLFNSFSPSVPHISLLYVTESPSGNLVKELDKIRILSPSTFFNFSYNEYKA